MLLITVGGCSLLLSIALTLIIASIPTSIPGDLIRTLSINLCLRVAIALFWARGTRHWGLAAVSYACLLAFCGMCLAALGAFGVIH